MFILCDCIMCVHNDDGRCGCPQYVFINKNGECAKAVIKDYISKDE